MKIIKISDSVRVCQASSHHLVNSVCINLGSELLFIDTGVTAGGGKKFREEMHRTFNVEKASLIITHADRDHYVGMEAFFDIPIIVAEKFMERFKIFVKLLNMRELERFQPTEIFTTEKIFGLENRTVIFELVGGHTDDSCYGYFPAEKILIASDNLLSSIPQHFLHDGADLYKSICCFKKWKELDITTIIPGHGNPVKKEYINPILGYYENLHEFLVEAKKATMTIENVLKDPNLPKYSVPYPENWTNWIEGGIKQVYKNINLK
ncbi:MAG: MBL fold metallo-hydrolase [Promethearchaeota archaeon]